VTSAPENKPHPRVRHPELYPWTLKISHAKLYLDQPVVIDAALRSRLQAFEAETRISLGPGLSRRRAGSRG